jgi:hypothetical protein
MSRTPRWTLVAYMNVGKGREQERKFTPLNVGAITERPNPIHSY